MQENNNENSSVQIEKDLQQRRVLQGIGAGFVIAPVVGYIGLHQTNLAFAVVLVSIALFAFFSEIFLLSKNIPKIEGFLCLFKPDGQKRSSAVQ